MTAGYPWRLHAGTISRAFLPPAHLRRHLVCVIERDTRGCNLHPLQAFTYGPVTPNMSIVWIWQGQPERLLAWRPDDLDAPRERITPSIMIRGGTTEPWIHYNSEPLHVLIAVFRPDALHQLFGLEPTEWLNRTQSLLDSKLQRQWIDWAHQILAAQSSSAALPLLYAGLEQHLDSEACAGHRPELAKRWLSRLQFLSGMNSQRTLQRRIRQLTGANARQLARFTRFEELGLVVSHALNKQQDLKQADLAVSTGFSDQPHMAREVRRALGFTISESLRRLLFYESFWLYRAKLSLHL